MTKSVTKMLLKNVLSSEKSTFNIIQIDHTIGDSLRSFVQGTYVDTNVDGSVFSLENNCTFDDDVVVKLEKPIVVRGVERNWIALPWGIQDNKSSALLY